MFVGERLSTFWEVGGAFFHNVIMTAKGRGRGERGTWLRVNADRAIRYQLRQFRYLFFMAPRFRRGLKLAVQPYPKAIRPKDDPATNGWEPGVTSGGRCRLRLCVRPGGRGARVAAGPVRRGGERP